MTATDKPTPSPETRAALVALLRADPGITPAHRDRILRAFDGDASEIVRSFVDRGAAPRLVQASVAAGEVGVATSTIQRWIEAGEITGRRIGNRRILVDLEEVRARAATMRKSPRKGP